MTNTADSLSLATILQKVSTERLQKAVAGIVSGEYRVTITQQTDQQVHGIMVNENGQEYRCTIMSESAACSCKDAAYRHVVCKHIAALALATIRPPRKGRASQGQNSSGLRLVWSRPTPSQHEQGQEADIH
jgi:uncharacterized Zn finger protein